MSVSVLDSSRPNFLSSPLRNAVYLLSIGAVESFLFPVAIETLVPVLGPFGPSKPPLIGGGIMKGS